MIDYIKGKINYVGEDYVVVENNYIGYKIYTSAYTISDLNGKREDAIVYTQMIVREDDIRLCGFSSRAELKVFDLLRTVKGVGTKVALGILSSIPYIQLINVLMVGDVTSLTRAPGIGKKTAQRIILELKDKVNKADEFGNLEDVDFDNKINIGSDNDEVIEALVSLGYSRIEAKKVLGKIDNSLPIEEMIKKALKLLVK
ncbi:Holliday junction branch migration protein RuvA [Paramaledivibacter caminithermalis]|jgi:Holliday junction DNA helicase RuvA|uniref:Holliday junction branch migration complex subunit RuvA n=1 Tax=Paramaledivibacter caminithermalis (strain DSM 15212 / CIP 107654 / DViRD3) TaxID=1121301 RepID=A0A1M6QV72_PARC5|nr:Holliday junction branch migration protein RuvA [Paramaledivibacter caminithermalis]SHK24013.1 Holliday junction DNA helicase subunit RuvA [Paramaledivibacter caminithermalis DSM 15212]